MMEDMYKNRKNIGVAAYMPDFIITGAGMAALEAARILEAKGMNGVIIMNHEDMINNIDINGIKYQEREQPQRSSAFTRGSQLASMAMSLAHVAYGGSNYNRPNPRVDVLDEYRLIMQKKSNLSKRDRDWVVRAFHKHYKKVEDEKL